MSNKKVLCILDSYPSEENKFAGNFYQQQLFILKDYVDIEVIVLEGKKSNIFGWLRNKISFVNTKFDDKVSIKIHRFKIHNPFFDKWLRNFSKLNRFILFRHIDSVVSELDHFCKQNLKATPDIIYVQTAQYIIPFAVPLKKKMGISLIAMEHYPVFAPMTNLWNVDDEFRQLVITESLKVDRFITVSNYLSSVMSNSGFRNRFEVIGNYVTAHEIQKNKKNNTFTVLYIGYNFHIKDPHTFFQSIVKIKQQDPSIKFIIVNGADSFDDFLKQYDVSDVTDVRYKLSYTDVIEIMQNEADVLVSTSMAETFGMAMAEAIVCGLPLICTNSGGNLEFVTHENSLLVDKKAPDQIANYVVALKNGDHTFKSDENRNRILDQFGKEVFIKKFLAEFNSTRGHSQQ
jgi:glycosyltransferase involved in cell wall biosynthesis